jgi:methylmalonyl-CoA/ethylmalonyl-CoA epimerase
VTIKFHHVGVAVRSIAAEGTRYCETLGIEPAGAVVADPIQRVSVAFARVGLDAAVEFVEPLGGESPIDRILRQGGGLYHVCYEVEDLDAQLSSVRQRGALLVSGPVPAVAFDGRRIAFVLLRGRHLVELLEAGSG